MNGLSIAIVASFETKLKKFVIIPKSGSDFFITIKNGCEMQAVRDEVNCTMVFPPGDSGNDNNFSEKEWQINVTQNIIAKHETGEKEHHIDGIAISILDNTSGEQILKKFEKAKIFAITFDSDVDTKSLRKHYVGSDNKKMGEFLAKVLEQINPEGGRYAIISGGLNETNLKHRESGIIERLEQKNDWIKDEDVDKSIRRRGEGDVIQFLYELVEPQKTITLINGIPIDIDSNPKNETECAEIFEKGGVNSVLSVASWPMRNNTKFKAFVDYYKVCKISVICGDASDVQLNLLREGYGDGLIGQLPYDMGVQIIRYLSKTVNISTTGNSISTEDTTHLLQIIRVPLILPTPELNDNRHGNLVYLGYMLYGFMLVSCTYYVFWTYKNRNKQVVKSSQPMFLYLISAGALMFSTSILFFSDDGHYSELYASTHCMGQMWLIGLGFTTLFSALFSKTWRINKIFQNAENLQRVVIETKDVLAPFLVLLGSNLVLLLCWTLIDPIEYERINAPGTDSWNRVVETYGTCHGDNDSRNVFYFIFGFICFVSISMALYQAFKARNIELEYSESWYIGVSFAFMFQLLLVGLPVLMLTDDRPKVFYVVAVITVFLISSITSGLIFIPKMKALHDTYASKAASPALEPLKENEQDALSNIKKKRSLRAELTSYKQSLQERCIELQDCATLVSPVEKDGIEIQINLHLEVIETLQAKIDYINAKRI